MKNLKLWIIVAAAAVVICCSFRCGHKVDQEKIPALDTVDQGMKEDTSLVNHSQIPQNN